MKEKIFIDDAAEFNHLLVRAKTASRKLADTAADDLVYFDSAIVTTHHYYRFVQDLLGFTDSSADTFAFVGLRPDPFAYFFHHFMKYPAIVFQPFQTEVDYCRLLQFDPGNSPADALAYNTWAYVVLPTAGNWITYGDDSSEIAVFSSTPEVNDFARKRLARDLVQPAQDFKIIV